MSATAILLIFSSTFLHAGWNLMLRAQRATYIAWRINLVVAGVGLGPVLTAELLGTRLPSQVWGLLIIAGIFQGIYYFGLIKGYQSGDFTVVYPIARALPILLVAIADVLRGDAPTPAGWLGMVLVSGGCLVIPLETISGFDAARYLNRTMIWIVITALGTVGYTITDNAAAGLLDPGPLAAARYGIFEFLFTTIFFWFILKSAHQSIIAPRGWPGWKWPVLGAIGVFGAYWLVLWRYELNTET